MLVQKDIHSHSSPAVLLLQFLLYVSIVSALYVVDNSKCAAQCTSSPSGRTTNDSDVTCYDTEYNRTGSGVTFRNCVSCELGSDAYDPQNGQEDVGWALFNMRYTVDYCLFKPPDNNSITINQCNGPCAELSDSLRINLSTPNISRTYDYCADRSFKQKAASCASCYYVIPDQRFLSNFLNTLSAACPTPSLPFPVAPSDVFTSDPPSNFSHVTHPSPGHDGTGLSHNAKVAIAICIPVGAFLLSSIGLLLLFIHCQTRRRPQIRPRTRPITRVTHFEKPISLSTISEHSLPDERQEESRQTHYSSRRTHLSSRQTKHSPHGSDESENVRISPFPTRRKAEKVPVPSNFRPRISPTPHPDREAQASPDDHPARDRNSPMPFFGKRIEIPVPNTTPDDRSDAKSVDENYAPTTASDTSLPPLSPQRSPPSHSDIPPIPRLTYKKPLAPATTPSTSVRPDISQPRSPVSELSPRTPSPDESRLLSGSPFATPTATEHPTPSSAIRPHSRAGTIPTVNISFPNPSPAAIDPQMSQPTSHPTDIPAPSPIPPPLAPRSPPQAQMTPSPTQPPPSHPPQRKSRPPDPAPFSSMFTSFQATDPISWDRLARQSDRHRREQRAVPSPGSAISPKSTPMPGFMEVGPWPAPARSGSTSYFAGADGAGEGGADNTPATAASGGGERRPAQRNTLISVFNTSNLGPSLRPSNSLREQRVGGMPHEAVAGESGLGGGPVRIGLRRSVSERVAESQRPMTPKVKESEEGKRQKPKIKALGRVRWKGREH